ncbi:MAG: hypothetical protein ACLSA2_04595 [Candidatus Gastranaerophilaceae bacterium]
MTMPVLISNHRHKVYEAQFKVAHSLVAQTLTQMGNENIDLTKMYCGTGMADRTQNIFIQDFAKYFKVVTSDYGNTADLTKLGYKDKTFFQSAPGRNVFNVDAHNNGAIVLSNGMMIASSGCWWTKGGIGIDFIIDTNGPKRPNKFGYDVFYFQLGTDNKLYPDTGNYLYAQLMKNNLPAVILRKLIHVPYLKIPVFLVHSMLSEMYTRMTTKKGTGKVYLNFYKLQHI